MVRKRKKKSKNRVCVEINRIQREMLNQLSDDEKKSSSAIFRDGLDLYFKAYLERRKVLSEFEI